MNVENSDLLVLSHLRWNFVFQRPQHLMVRFAKHRKVYFIEPAIAGDVSEPQLHLSVSEENVTVVVPYVPKHFSPMQTDEAMRIFVDQVMKEYDISDFTAWYYNPMGLIYTDHLNPSYTIYDCMDELSGFQDCPKEMKDWEMKLLERADVVFTGGNSIYQAKKDRHSNIHPFPSSIDHHHFHQARATLPEPYDQVDIPHPRIGFYGVIEERIDLELLEQMATLRPDYHFIMVGPVIRIDEATLPRLSNIHYLQKKDYKELPLYLSGWDCAMMPFAMNEATKYISPTKTPEFLAAGRPVVSTPVNDVVHPYASEASLIYIASSAHDFVTCIDRALEQKNEDEWLRRVDEFLAGNSWDSTFQRMAAHEAALNKRQEVIDECTGSAFRNVGGTRMHLQ